MDCIERDLVLVLRVVYYTEGSPVARYISSRLFPISSNEATLLHCCLFLGLKGKEILPPSDAIAVPFFFFILPRVK